jgi:HEAT repeat protein
MLISSELSREEEIQRLRSIVEDPDPLADHSLTLQGYLDDPDPEVRELAFRGLWEYPEPEFIPVLFAAATDDPVEQVRCQAIRTLGRYVWEGMMTDYDSDFGPLNEALREDELPQEDWERVQQFLLGIYRDGDKSVDERRFAVEALSFLSNEEILDIIAEVYAHPYAKMKISAIFAMGRNGNERWGDILRKELYNPDSERQWEAIRAVGEAQWDEAGKDLWRLTYAEDKEIKLAAIWALGQTGWEGAFERLDELSSMSIDPEVREMAEEALEEWLIYSQDFEDDLFGEYDSDSYEMDFD